MTQPSTTLTEPSILVRPSPTSTPQNQMLYRIYVGYRSLLSAVFLLLLLGSETRGLVGVVNAELYLGAAIAFMVSNLALLFTLNRDWQRSNTFLVLLFSIDIISIMLLADSSGGMTSGLPLLLTITVASSAVLISNRTLATLVAALSVLAILVDTVRLISLGYLGITDLLPTGLLGLLLFAVSAIVQATASRLGRAEALALARTSDLYNLQRLNEQIVQSMQTGILLVDETNHVRVMNQAASAMLMPDRPTSVEQGRELGEYSEELHRRLTAFRERRVQNRSPFRIDPEGSELVPRFRSLDIGIVDAEGEVLVFIEDYTPVAQYAQSLKLGSLGRLTASIAHEIRNPLGAISHAAQLMGESPHSSSADQRMLDIIMTNSKRVNEIVESVLQISRREPPRPQLLQLPDWLEEQLQRYRSMREDEAAVSCSSATRPQIEFDPEHLQRILGNLLDNALRHSALKHEHATARIEVHEDTAGNHTHIDVIDDGDGVDKKDVGRLFEPFFSRTRGGSGMGLYLCRELCELNHANLVYHPTATGETCFRISVPNPDL